jgi:hypothetical protein
VGVGGVDPDPDDISWRDRLGVEPLQSLVNEPGIAVFPGRRRGEHVEPARGNDGDAERNITRIHEVNAHALPYATSDHV